MTPGSAGPETGATIPGTPRLAAAAASEDIRVPDVALSKKQLKRLLDGARPLDAWERYRALNDAIDEAYDLIDVSNREARFALIMLGGLNALILIAAGRSDLVASLDEQYRPWTGGLLVGYAGVAVFFLLEAIKALRPGKFRPDLGGWSADSEDYPRRVRYFEDVVLRDVQGHWRAWREVQVEQLNAELAVQLHSLSQKNQSMRISLRRLYTGLRVMTLLVTALLMLFAFSVWM
jgi:hypothetical protein